MTFDEVRDRANQLRGTPLEAVLDTVGAEQDRCDKAKWHTDRGVVSVTGTKFFNWSLGRGGGGAIDLVIHLKELRFKAAVHWLDRHFPGAGYPPEQVPSLQAPPLKLPPNDAGKLPDVKRYLVHDRGIPTSLIESLIASGRFYADSKSNAVFPLLGKGSMPVGAELRGTGNHPWRGLTPGSRKDLGYFSVPAPDATTIVLCESAIDAVSCFALHPGHLCISTSGARPDPLWLAPLIRRGPQVYCGFDCDPTGERMASAMIAGHPIVKRLRPPLHDWNDVLRSQS